jgi:hypothetical protein
LKEKCLRIKQAVDLNFNKSIKRAISGVTMKHHTNQFKLNAICAVLVATGRRLTSLSAQNAKNK